MKPFNIEAYNAMSPDEMVRDLSGHMVWIMCLDGKLSPYYAPDRPVVAVVHYGDGWSNTFTYPPNGQFGANPSDADLVIVKRDAPGLNWIDATPARQNLFVHAPPPPRRPLSSLTEEEAKALFKAAFGRFSNDDAFKWTYESGNLEVSQYNSSGTLYHLSLWGNGFATGSTQRKGSDPFHYEAIPINIAKVVRFLDSIGIEIG